MGGGNLDGSTVTPGDGEGETSPKVTHQLVFQDGLFVQYRAVPVNIDNISELTYEWDLGDNTKGEGAEISHTYANDGAYNVSVIVKRNGVYLAQYTNPYSVYKGTGLVNNVLMAEPDLSDKLKYYFYSSASSNDDISFTWDFGDGSESVVTGNSNTNQYKFPKYGKTYPVTVTSNMGSNSLESTVLIDIPGVTVDMQCSTNGLTVICTPILPPEIPDMTVTWDCGNGQTHVTTGQDVVVCEYDDTATDVTVKVEGTDDNLEGSVKNEQNFTLSKLFSMEIVDKKATSDDKLTWQISVNGELKSDTSTDLSQYKVQYRFNYGDGKDFGEWKDADENYNITDNYTFERYPINSQNGYDVKVEARVLKNGLDPEVSSTNTKFNISAPTASLKRENLANSEGFGQRFCVTWPDYVPAGALRYVWNFGDGNGGSGVGNAG